MKTTIKNISLLLASLALSASLTTASAQITNSYVDTDDTRSTYVDPVAAIHQNIANLELEMESLRMVDKAFAHKSEKRAWKRKSASRAEDSVSRRYAGKIDQSCCKLGILWTESVVLRKSSPPQGHPSQQFNLLPSGQQPNRTNTSATNQAPRRSSLKNQRALRAHGSKDINKTL